MRGAVLVLLLLLVGSVIAGCGASPPSDATVSRPASWRDRFVFPANKSGERPLFLQEARPFCPDGNQPVVAEYRDSPEGARPLEWGCATGCGPGQEYVTLLAKDPGRGFKTAQCARVCPLGFHRPSYVVVEETSCLAGPPAPEAAAALAREQEAQRAAFLATESELLSEGLEQLRPLETAPRPWNEADDDRWSEARARLREIEDARAHLAVALAPNPAAADLASRVARFAADDGEYHALRDKRSRWKSAGIEQADQACLADCDRRQERCASECRLGGPEVCAACDGQHQACLAAFETYRQQRAASHVYGSAYPPGCGPGPSGRPASRSRP